MRNWSRGFLFVVLVVFLSIGLVAPAAAQPAADGSNSSGGPAAESSGRTVVADCEDVKNEPPGEGVSYRIVRGDCSMSLSNGDILENVWFKADGGQVDIDASGTGWTIRNVAVTNHSASEDPPFNLRVESSDGVGLMYNVWASDLASNVLFVHPKHKGKIEANRVTFTDVAEDGAYASRPGNPPSITDGNKKIEGNEGTVGFEQAYVKDVGFGPETGYGLRLGSDGSYIVNSTLVNIGGPAVANTFASGKNPKQRSDTFDGVLFRNVDIIQPDGAGSGVRLNNHQGRIKPDRRWTAVTTFENVDIRADEPIDNNEAGGTDPVIRGEIGSNPDRSPPPGAPRTPVRAASGVGGGTGTIGGPSGGIFSPIIAAMQTGLLYLGGFAVATLLVGPILLIILAVFIFVVWKFGGFD